MRTRHFYGLLHTASDIIGELNAGKSTVIQFPGLPEQIRWKNQILGACESVLLLENEPSSFELINVDETGLTPTELMNEFGVSAEPILERFLTEFGREPLAIAFSKPLHELPEWSKWLVDITRFQKTLSGDDYGRFLIFFTVGIGLPEEVTWTDLGCFQFWNPVRWEDMRLAARHWLGAPHSDAESTWMIATYTGASNLDPDLLAELCDRQPRTLRDVVEYVTSRIESDPESQPANESQMELSERSAWKLPANLIDDWSNCGLFGQTTERGSRRDLSSVSSQERERKLYYQIWQEQAAGLLPLIVELSVSANRLLDSWLPAGWRSTLAESADTNAHETYFVETALLVQFIESLPNVHLAEMPYRLLKQLRHLRNRLAHLQAVELSALQRLWDLYLRTKAASETVSSQAGAAALERERPRSLSSA